MHGSWFYIRVSFLFRYRTEEVGFAFSDLFVALIKTKFNDRFSLMNPASWKYHKERTGALTFLLNLNIGFANGFNASVAVFQFNGKRNFFHCFINGFDVIQIADTVFSSFLK